MEAWREGLGDAKVCRGAGCPGGCSHGCCRWGEKSSVAPGQGRRGPVAGGRREGMPSPPFRGAFRLPRERGAGVFGLSRQRAGNGRVFHEALGLSSRSSGCPKHLPGGIQERKDACGLAGEASWRCDWMKSHFPPVTQQATTELPDEERRRSTYLQAPSLPKIPLSIQLPPAPARPPPCIPARLPGEGSPWGPVAQLDAPGVIPSAMLCFIRLTAAA